MAHGARRMVHGAWRMAHGAWRMAHGAWRMAHGAWRMAHGIASQRVWRHAAMRAPAQIIGVTHRASANRAARRCTTRSSSKSVLVCKMDASRVSAPLISASRIMHRASAHCVCALIITDSAPRVAYWRVTHRVSRIRNRALHISASHIVRASGIVRHALLTAERPVSRIGTLRMCIVHRAWTCRGTPAIAALSRIGIGVG